MDPVTRRTAIGLAAVGAIAAVGPHVLADEKPPEGKGPKEPSKVPAEGVRIEELESPAQVITRAMFLEHDYRGSTKGAVKTAVWDRLFVGDCGEEPGATLTLRSDGTASFECVTFTNSTHHGDYWWAAFLLQDKDNVTLHSEPYHKGPRMDDGNPPPRYRWGFNFNFNAGIFEKITKVRYGFKC